MKLRPLVHGSMSEVGLCRLARHAFRNRPLVLCYHGVCKESPDGPDPEGMQVPDRLFEEQMRFLLRHYRPVTLDMVARYLAGEESLPPRAVLLTFDDGYRNVVRNAFPILRKLGIPCAMFLVAGLVGTERFIWTAELELLRGNDRVRRDLKQRLKGMSQRSRAEALRTLLPSVAQLPGCDSSLCGWDEMRSWIGPNLAIGSHGMTHEPLTTCDDASLEWELTESRNTIEENLGIRVEALAYPKGDHAPRVIDEVVRCGYSLAFTTAPRHLRSDEGRFTIPRVLVGGEDKIPVFESRLSGWIEWMRSG